MLARDEDDAEAEDNDADGSDADEDDADEDDADEDDADEDDADDVDTNVDSAIAASLSTEHGRDTMILGSDGEEGNEYDFCNGLALRGT